MYTLHSQFTLSQCRFNKNVINCNYVCFICCFVFVFVFINFCMFLIFYVYFILNKITFAHIPWPQFDPRTGSNS